MDWASGVGCCRPLGPSLLVGLRRSSVGLVSVAGVLGLVSFLAVEVWAK